MKKYIIIVSVYDQENTQAYPLGGVFDTQKSAERYIAEHWQDIKKDHWTKDCVNGEDFYKEEFSIGGSFHAEDMSVGSSLDITIFEAPVISDYFEVCSVNREDIDSRGFDASGLDDEDMQRIASKMNDLICNGCEYWTALEGACEYWVVPIKDEK